MTIKRCLSVFALVVLVASSAHAEHAKREVKPTDKATPKTAATSIRDWHPQLNAATPRTAPTMTCTCGKTSTQTATPATPATPRTAPTTTVPGGKTITQTTTTATPAGQRTRQGKGSSNPSERAQEVPLRSLRP